MPSSSPSLDSQACCSIFDPFHVHTSVLTESSWSLSAISHSQTYRKVFPTSRKTDSPWRVSWEPSTCRHHLYATSPSPRQQHRPILRSKGHLAASKTSSLKLRSPNSLVSSASRAWPSMYRASSVWTTGIIGIV